MMMRDITVIGILFSCFMKLHQSNYLHTQSIPRRWKLTHSNQRMIGIMPSSRFSAIEIAVLCTFLVVIQKVDGFTLQKSRQGFLLPTDQNHRKIRQMVVTDMTSSSVQEKDGNGGGTYRPFATYAWEKLLSSGLVGENVESPVPDHLAMNSSPLKFGPEGAAVNIEVKSADSSSGTSEIMPIRMARYALLETVAPAGGSDDTKEIISLPDAIQVLNLVLFPHVALPLPVLGMDLVTLPGGKNLIAIDFQPILPPPQSEKNDEGNEGENLSIFSAPFEKYEERIQELHQKHVLNQSDILPWGGDIPQQAKRFFSPYALWTRLQGEEALNTIQNEVYNAFCDYFDLYIEIMLDVMNNGIPTSDNAVSENSKDVIKGGHLDYLNYRRENDPARPMLKRLYGEDYTEEVITEILFRAL